MACGSGCCGQVANAQTTPPVPLVDENSSKLQVEANSMPEVKIEDETATDGMRVACTQRVSEHAKQTCGNDSAPPTCCKPAKEKTTEEPAKETTCTDMGPGDIDYDRCTPKPAPSSGCIDDCCAPKAAPINCADNCRDSSQQAPDRSCVDACCSSKEKLVDDDSPSCCEGKTSPCCDETCIDRLALRECESASTSSCALDGKPCVEHKRTTRSKYAARLESLGCICRALVTLGQDSCCPPSRRSQRHRSLRLRRSTASIDSCCAPGVSSCGSKTTKHDKQKVKRSRKTSESCGGPATVPAVKPDIQPLSADVEKGGSQQEHVVLSISGMTCTGCETKLARTLGTHPAVANLKTSLVMSRAEFDLVSNSNTTVDDVKKYLERTTEFTCEKISNQGSTINILVPAGHSADALIGKAWPDGVLEVRAVDKSLVSVSFDAKIIGARDLVSHGWGEGPLLLAPPSASDPSLEAGSHHVRHLGFMSLLSVCLTIPVLVLAWAPLLDRPIAYGSASLALATVVQFVIAGPFYPKAVKALVFSRVIEMDLLVVLSTTTAYIFSVVSFAYTVVGKPLSTGEFFETSTLLVTLIMIGRWVAALARQKAVESISIRSLQTPTATIVDHGSGQDMEIDCRLLQYGDVFKVIPDSKIPTDGTVVWGASEVDESMITGESRLVAKQPKFQLVAGSINSSGTMQARVTRLPGENTISAIAAMVDEAKLSKPKIQALADHIASYFVPVIVLLTIVVFCIWMGIGIAVRGQSGSEATIQAITYAITVLIVSCPCAVGLAVPMVIVIASGVAAERGVIFKSAEAIEVMHKTTHVVFDKTGTITQGKLTVVCEWYSKDSSNGISLASTKGLLLGLLEGIKHPVSASVVEHLKAQGVSACTVHDKKSLPGKGVEGVAEPLANTSEKHCGANAGLLLQAGNSRWLNLSEHAVVQSALVDGHTTFCFTVDGVVTAILALSDSLRQDSVSTVQKLMAHGISVHLVSGDDDGAVQAVASQLAIPGANVRSRCSPAEKKSYVQDLTAGNNKDKRTKTPVVVFCGDGTNDAAAIAQATIGVHMNDGGTDVAQSAADVVLMRPDLDGILVAIAVSRKSIRRIAFNFGWSFVYNLVAILLAAGAFVHARIPPEYAGLGELVSVLPVVFAATLLRWAKI